MPGSTASSRRSKHLSGAEKHRRKKRREAAKGLSVLGTHVESASGPSGPLGGFDAPYMHTRSRYAGSSRSESKNRVEKHPAPRSGGSKRSRTEKLGEGVQSMSLLSGVGKKPAKEGETGGAGKDHTKKGDAENGDAEKGGAGAGGAGGAGAGDVDMEKDPKNDPADADDRPERPPGFSDHPERAVPFPDRNLRTERWHEHDKFGTTLHISLIDNSEVPHEPLGDWACKFYGKPPSPGDVIKATHCYAQNDLNVKLGDGRVRLFDDGPVYSKARFMIVLYHTSDGLVCAPMYSRETGLPRSNAGQAEYVSITYKGQKWEGETPWNGKPLQMNLPKKPEDKKKVDDKEYKNDTQLKKMSFVHLAKPVFISQWEQIDRDLARLTKASWVTLMDLVDFYRNKHRTGAFKSKHLINPEEFVIPNYPKADQQPSVDVLSRRSQIGLTNNEMV